MIPKFIEQESKVSIATITKTEDTNSDVHVWTLEDKDVVDGHLIQSSMLFGQSKQQKTNSLEECEVFIQTIMSKSVLFKKRFKMVFTLRLASILITFNANYL